MSPIESPTMKILPYETVEAQGYTLVANFV